MAALEIQSNLKCITSGNVPTTTELANSEFAFGLVDGEPKLYGNVNGTIVDFSGDITIDVNTLIALLSGGNGIEVVKNATGDKVELKIPDRILISNSLGTAQLSPQTISLFFNSENVGFLIDAIAGGMYKTNGSEQQWYLHQGNVKTINGQSIYGSGDIQSYPVGSIYLSTFSTSPSSLFGGTWEQIKDVFLLAAGDTYTAGSTGGSANAVVVRHAGHIVNVVDRYGVGNATGRFLDRMGSYGSTGRGWDVDSGNEFYPASHSEGVDGTGKNMPPYLTVYMWERIL